LSTVKQAGVGEMVNIAHFGAMLGCIANFSRGVIGADLFPGRRK